MTWRVFFRVMRCSGYFLLPTLKGRVRPPWLSTAVPGFWVRGMPTMASQVSCSFTTSTGLPSKRALGALAAGPRSTTATPPGTGLFSVRVM
ncbi:hypothetical protein D9M71_800320 [compost metagenome]